MNKIILLILSSIFVHAQIGIQQNINNINNSLVIQTNPYIIIDNHQSNFIKVLDEIIIQINESGSLVNRLKFYYKYDNRANVICRGTADWTMNKWMEDSRTCYEFNNDNKVTLKYDQQQIDSEWLTEGEQIFTYNDDGQLIRLLRKDNRNDYNNEIENSRVFDYLYDESGNQIEEISSMWLDWENVPRWEYQRKVKNVFVNSLIIEQNYFWWNSMSLSWDTTSKTAHYYNENNDLVLTENYFFDDNKWFIYRRLQVEYDNNYNIIDSLEQNWVDGSWQNQYQIQREYENNLLIKENWFMWDYSDGILRWNGTHSYKYNDKKLRIEFLEEIYSEGVLISASRVEYSYDSDGDLTFGDLYFLENGNWIYSAKSIYNYSTITDRKSDKKILHEVSLSQNYPNPFNPSTTIKYSLPLIVNGETANVKGVTLRIYDLLGKEAATLVNKKQKPGNYEVEFDGSELTSGIYFYKLKAGSFVETKKMILLK